MVIEELPLHLEVIIAFNQHYLICMGGMLLINTQQRLQHLVKTYVANVSCV